MLTHNFSTPSADDLNESRCTKCGKLPPDSITLNDYILLNFPQVHNATRYINDHKNQYNCWLEIWIANNKCHN